jgi:protein-tyrosine-phosphatase
LLSQKVVIEPKKSWQILYNLPAEARSAEAINSQHAIWLQEHDVIISIFSDKEYMRNLYNQFNFIVAMQREELKAKSQI